ncbi:hypothetical protein NDU88_009101 [Pleurodeles waltl]|uniref:Uncharacterized protein n=1 Tax=Pleurodeles waltl TaxID=8319 RepID=A0AAV7QWG6_PLEWA|nr:hypothetical protein NDU88_009101 [Pleurodeles waltl]
MPPTRAHGLAGSGGPQSSRAFCCHCLTCQLQVRGARAGAPANAEFHRCLLWPRCCGLWSHVDLIVAGAGAIRGAQKKQGMVLLTHIGSTWERAMRF